MMNWVGNGEGREKLKVRKWRLRNDYGGGRRIVEAESLSWATLCESFCPFLFVFSIRFSVTFSKKKKKKKNLEWGPESLGILEEDDE